MQTKMLSFPWIKRFKGMFAAMVILMGTGMSFTIGMITTYVSLKEDYDYFLNEYHAPDCYIETIGNTTNYSSELLGHVEGIKSITPSVKIKTATYIPKINRSGNCNIITYNDGDKDVFEKYYERESICGEFEYPIYVEYNYARNNSIKAGDVIKIGYLDCYIDARVTKIVSFPDDLVYGQVNGLISGTTDFGYIFTSRNVLIKISSNISNMMRLRYEGLEYNNDKTEYFEARSNLEKILNYEDSFVNRYVIEVKEDYKDNVDNVLEETKDFLTSKGETCTFTYTKEETESYKAATGLINIMYVMSVALPIVFYIVVLSVISLFIGQIINALQRDIGILKANGVKNRDISKAISLFLFITSICSVIMGSIIGIGLSYIFIVLVKTGIGFIGISVNAFKYVIPICCTIVIVLFQLVSLIATCKIFKISPKEAFTERKDNLKDLSPKLEKIIQKLTITWRLAINLLARNFSRVIISILSLCISINFICIGVSMVISKDRALEQSFKDSILYDAQLIVDGEVTDELKTNLIDNASITRMQEAYIIPIIKLEYGGKEENITLMSFENDNTKMLKIPSIDGEGTQFIGQYNEIILDKRIANKLGIEEGGIVAVNNVQLKVCGITNQYAVNTCYCSDETMKNIAPTEYNVSLLVKVQDTEIFEKYVSKHMYCSSPIVTKYAKDESAKKNMAIDITAYAITAVFILFGLLVVTMMSISNLQSQKRSLSILRALGFSMIKTSYLWLIQLLSQYILSAIIAFPFSVYFTNLILNAMSSEKITFPFSNKTMVYLITYLLVLIFILVSHIIVINRIKRWNIAENTKSKE